MRHPPTYAAIMHLTQKPVKMAETSQIMFSHKEVVEALIKKQGLYEGIWMLAINFGMQATNVGTSDTDLKPSAIVGVLSIGLHRTEKETALSADAAKVNPKPKGPKHN
jgi:uncharacterized membrane protein